MYYVKVKAGEIAIFDIKQLKARKGACDVWRVEITRAAPPCCNISKLHGGIAL